MRDFFKEVMFLLPHYLWRNMEGGRLVFLAKEIRHFVNIILISIIIAFLYKASYIYKQSKNCPNETNFLS